MQSDHLFEPHYLGTELQDLGMMALIWGWAGEGGGRIGDRVTSLMFPLFRGAWCELADLVSFLTCFSFVRYFFPFLFYNPGLVPTQ